MYVSHYSTISSFLQIIRNANCLNLQRNPVRRANTIIWRYIYRFPTVNTLQPDASPSRIPTLSSISVTILENISQSQGMTSVCMSGSLLRLTPPHQENLTHLKNSLLRYNLYTTKLHILKQGRGHEETFGGDDSV